MDNVELPPAVIRRPILSYLVVGRNDDATILHRGWCFDLAAAAADAALFNSHASAVAEVADGGNDIGQPLSDALPPPYCSS